MVTKELDLRGLGALGEHLVDVLLESEVGDGASSGLRSGTEELLSNVLDSIAVQVVARVISGLGETTVGGALLGGLEASGAGGETSRRNALDDEGVVIGASGHGVERGLSGSESLFEDGGDGVGTSHRRGGEDRVVRGANRVEERKSIGRGKHIEVDGHLDGIERNRRSWFL